MALLNKVPCVSFKRSRRAYFADYITLCFLLHTYIHSLVIFQLYRNFAMNNEEIGRPKLIGSVGLSVLHVSKEEFWVFVFCINGFENLKGYCTKL